MRSSVSVTRSMNSRMCPRAAGPCWSFWRASVCPGLSRLFLNAPTFRKFVFLGVFAPAHDFVFNHGAGFGVTLAGEGDDFFAAAGFHGQRAFGWGQGVCGKRGGGHAINEQATVNRIFVEADEVIG